MLRNVRSSISGHDHASISRRGHVSDLIPRKTMPASPGRTQPTPWFKPYHRLKALQGYHFGVLCCAVVTSLVSFLNIGFLAWAIGESGVQSGLATLQDGSCHKTHTLTLWAHLVINVLATLLLGASNYSMQCLSSPTRREIDKAHSQGVWLDIGVPSFRNLRKLSPLSILLWWLLAISSIPLHLLYNSAVFSTLSTRQYDVYVVASNFFEEGPINSSIIGNIPSRQFYGGEGLGEILRGWQHNTTSFERLENEACLKAYSANIISSRSDVVLVSSTPDSSNSFLAIYPEVDAQVITNSVFHSRGWMCEIPISHTCDAFQTVQNPREWSVGLHPNNKLSQQAPVATPIQYCLSQPIEEHCKLEVSLAIVIVVVSCNLLKAICMGIIAWKKDLEPLVTLGDAIASFLDQPDPTTEGNCLVGRDRFEKSKDWQCVPSQWDAKPMRWFRAASPRRWLVCNLL